MKLPLDKLDITLQSISFKCPKCKEIMRIEGGVEIFSHGRAHSFDPETNKGHIRCETCGFLTNYSLEGTMILNADVKGLSCGICGEIVEKLYDRYFCKKHYIEHIKKEAKHWEEAAKEELDKIKGL